MIFAAIFGWFRTNPRNVWLIATLIGVIALVLFIYFKGRGDEAEKNEAARAVAVAEAIERDGVADGKATQTEIAAAQESADLKERLIDEVAKAPDDVPDESSVRYGCEQLRQQGVRTSDLPACVAVGH